jgi:hypothetical protein
VGGKERGLRVARRGVREDLEAECAELALGLDDAERCGCVGSDTSLTTVRSRPSPARATVAPMLTFCGYCRAASRALPSKKVVRWLRAGPASFASAGVPCHAIGGFSDAVRRNRLISSGGIPYNVFRIRFARPRKK